LILKVFFASFLKSCKKTLTDATRWAEKWILARTKGLVRPELVTGAAYSADVKTAELPVLAAVSIFCHTAVERHLHRLVHSDLHGLRTSLSKVSLEDLALGADRRRGSTIDSAALHLFGDRSFARGGTVGLIGDVAIAAYLDLIIRSCPSGLQGTTRMMSGGLYFIASRFGDVLGTNLYDHFGGFSVRVITVMVVYALILPTRFLVPRRLYRHRRRANARVEVNTGLSP
jgi:hypothetical protein